MVKNLNNTLYCSYYINRWRKVDGLTVKRLAECFKESERTIYRRSKRDRYKNGRKLKLDGEALETFLNHISERNNYTQQEMADYASQLTGQPITRFIISRTLKNNEITRKRPNNHYGEQNEEKIDEFKSKFYPLLDFPILALDECNFPLNLSPRYAYSKKGTRANTWKTGKRGGSYTLILCIANVEKQGVILYQLVGGGVDAKVLHNFLSQIKFLTKDKNYLIMDNVRIHHASWACKKLGLSTIKELLKSKNIEALYLPAYTPELNPVELCFNFIKHQVEKDKPKTFEELDQTIDKIMNMLSEKDMTKYFRKCSEYFDYKQKPEKGWEKVNVEEHKKKWDLFFKE